MGTGNGAFSDKNVGNNKTVSVSGYSLGGFDAGNYRLIEPTGLTANISPASLAVTGVTANNKVYDGTVTASLAGTATVTALGSDRVTVVGTGKGVFSDKNVGSDKTVSVSGYSFSGADAGNYILIEPTGLTANVAARSLTVSATASNKVYDGLTDASVTLSDNRVAGDVLATGYTSAAFTDANAGTGKTVRVSGITLSGVDAGNYIFNTTATTTASITPAPLTVAANNVSKLIAAAAYGESTAAQASTSSSGTMTARNVRSTPAPIR
jgi:hypothetical protein